MSLNYSELDETDITLAGQVVIDVCRELRELASRYTIEDSLLYQYEGEKLKSIFKGFKTRSEADSSALLYQEQKRGQQ